MHYPDKGGHKLSKSNIALKKNFYFQKYYEKGLNLYYFLFTIFLSILIFLEFLFLFNDYLLIFF